MSELQILQNKAAKVMLVQTNFYFSRRERLEQPSNWLKRV